MEIVISKMSLYSSLGIPSRDFLKIIRTVCSGTKNRCRIKQDLEICAMSLQIMKEKCSLSHDRIETSLAITDHNLLPLFNILGVLLQLFKEKLIKEGTLSAFPPSCFLFLDFSERGC